MDSAVGFALKLLSQGIEEAENVEVVHALLNETAQVLHIPGASSTKQTGGGGGGGQSQGSGDRTPEATLREAVYGRSQFPTLANILLFQVAPDWLLCFSREETARLFDAFFLAAPPGLLLEALLPALVPPPAADEGVSSSDLSDASATRQHAERCGENSCYKSQGVSFSVRVCAASPLYLVLAGDSAAGGDQRRSHQMFGSLCLARRQTALAWRDSWPTQSPPHKQFPAPAAGRNRLPR
eukprot:jgi/Mesen1/2078/ME000151S01344